VRRNGIISRHGHTPGSIAQDDVFALPDDPEAGPFQLERRADAESPQSHPLNRDFDLSQLSVRAHSSFADDISVQLKMLAQPALLLSLIAKKLRH